MQSFIPAIKLPGVIIVHSAVIAHLYIIITRHFFLLKRDQILFLCHGIHKLETDSPEEIKDL